MTINKRSMAYGYIVLAAVIFSTMEIAGKMVATQINPMQITFYRFFIGGIVLLPWAVKELRERKLELTKDDAVFFFLVGLLGIAVSMTLYQLAVVFAMASTVAIIVCANPIFIIPFAHFLLKEKLTRATIVSLVLSVLGILCILNPFHLNPDVKGIVLAIVSTVSFSLYTVMGKKRSARYGSLGMTCFSFLSGSLIMLVYILISQTPLFAAGDSETLRLLWDIPLVDGINQGNIVPLVYMGVVVSGLGFLLYFRAMELTSAATGAIAFFIKPALAPILSFLILGETISANTIAGIVLMTISTYIAFAGKTSTEG
ncbi:MAG: DMT family transporter [Negativicutes bacterium]|nr:DMT family transporter [Negativicutes bacterium]MDR3591224.1 DMT family transporter [Negativicutes bacterium]